MEAAPNGSQEYDQWLEHTNFPEDYRQAALGEIGNRRARLISVCGNVASCSRHRCWRLRCAHPTLQVRQRCCRCRSEQVESVIHLTMTRRFRLGDASTAQQHSGRSRE
jgi:hypothetical protein